ncbi:hypothetical protein ACSBOB_00925 [Mesorhizobium sp. ASY16-5R]|uniref:hypothetical protein n=1 Tax=Mesorhizobium sp. ASY16-5R TaxID=3445772 RepID=UPI003F9F61F7
MKQSQESNLPTLLDHMAAIEARLSLNVAEGKIDSDLIETLVRVFACQGVQPNNIIDLLIFGRACHSGAQAFQTHGHIDTANLLHAMGQDMLSKTVNMISHLAAQSISEFGGVKH